MSPIITYTLLIFMGLYFITIFVGLITNRSWKRFLIELLILAGFITILYMATGFPAPSSRQAFGGISPISAIGIMFVCTILGIVAHYFFYLKGKFSLGMFLKPLFISPIVLLPLIGSVQGTSDLESIQMISFAILAFQNGFFWKAVLEHAKQQL